MAETSRELPNHLLPIEEARARALERAVEASGGGDPSVTAESLSMDGADGHEIPLRRYSPPGDVAAPGLIVFFHGGGWVYGDLDSHDGMCRDLASSSGCTVIAVAYRLAPEHPYPAGLEDARDALNWALTGADPGRVAVAGDSSGANLAAAACLARRDSGLPGPAFQLLVYPCLDLTLSQPSMVEAEGRRFGGRSEIAWTVDRYLAGGVDPRDPLVSPLWAASHAGLPAAHVVTAGFDPLLDEAVAYVRALDAAGVPVTHRHYELQIHGFLSFAGVLPDAREAIEDIGRAVRLGIGVDRPD